MSESKVKEEQNKVSFEEWVKALVVKAVDEKQGNDDINNTVQTIMNRIYKETVHKGDVVAIVHLIPGADQGTKVLSCGFNRWPRYMLDQAFGMLQRTFISTSQYIDYLEEQQKQAEKKIVLPGDNGKHTNRIEGIE